MRSCTNCRLSLVCAASPLVGECQNWRRKPWAASSVSNAPASWEEDSLSPMYLAMLAKAELAKTAAAG